MLSKLINTGSVPPVSPDKPGSSLILIFQSYESAFRYSLVSAQSLQLLHGHPEVERVKVPFLKLAVSLAVSLGHDPRPYNKQLSELRYTGVKTDSAPPLMEVVRWGTLLGWLWAEIMRIIISGRNISTQPREQSDPGDGSYMRRTLLPTSWDYSMYKCRF